MGTKQPVIATANKRCHARGLAKSDPMGGTFFGCRGGRVHPSFILPLSVPHTPITLQIKSNCDGLCFNTRKYLGSLLLFPPKNTRCFHEKRKCFETCNVTVVSITTQLTTEKKMSNRWTVTLPYKVPLLQKFTMMRALCTYTLSPYRET